MRMLYNQYAVTVYPLIVPLSVHRDGERHSQTKVWIVPSSSLSFYKGSQNLTQPKITSHFLLLGQLFHYCCMQ